MVKCNKSKKRRNRKNKGFEANTARPRKINASTQHETCTEQISPFGGLLAMIKFFDLIGFKQIFQDGYRAPVRQPKLGNYQMVVGLLMLLFIGFNRIWHFTYIRLDAILCGFFRLSALPVASTFWRYVDSMGVNQAVSLLKLMAAIRERVWTLLELSYHRICLDIDTTVETIYGNQQGGRKGHNTKNRGKKGYRPVLCIVHGNTRTSNITVAFISPPGGKHRIVLWQCVYPKKQNRVNQGNRFNAFFSKMTITRTGYSARACHIQPIKWSRNMTNARMSRISWVRPSGKALMPSHRQNSKTTMRFFK